MYLGDLEGGLTILDIDQHSGKGKLVQHNATAHQSQINNLISLNEFELLTSSIDDNVKIFDTNLLKPFFEVFFQHQSVSSLEANRIDRLIYTGHFSGSIKAFDERTRSKTAAQVFESGNSTVSQIKSNLEDGLQFVSGEYSGVIRTWDRRMGKSIYAIDAHERKKVFALEWVDKS